jgi:hypothetical protein
VQPVAERTTIAFADTAGEIAGVAISGAASLLWLAGELTAAAPAQLAGSGPAWTLSAAGAYELELESLGEPASFAAGTTIWLCRASGQLEERDLDGLATVTLETASPAFTLQRSLSIALERELSFAVRSCRPSGAVGHGEEQLEAVVWRGDPAVAAPIERPRLSTTYDAAAIARHAGIELWEDEEAEYTMRIGGEALGNGEIAHPDGERSRVVFMAWHHESHRAIGSYTLTSAARI